MHRDAAAKGQEAIRRSTVTVLAQLTFRHPKNLAQLQSDCALLGNSELYSEVVAVHESSELSPRAQHAFSGLFSGSLPTLSAITAASRASTASDGNSDSPPHSARGVHVPSRKGSLDASGGSRAFRRMSSSVRGMFGSMRKALRNQGSEDGGGSIGQHQGLSSASLLPTTAPPPRLISSDSNNRVCVV